MPIICSNPRCKQTNVDGTSYCVKCGRLLSGMKEKKVVIKDDYDRLNNRKEELERDNRQLNDRIYTLTNTDKVRVEQIQRQQRDLDDISKNGSAPAGFTLISNNALKNERDKAATEIEKLKMDLEKLRSKGYAPSGFHIERDKTWYERFAYKTIRTTEYNSLLTRANMSWWQKLCVSIKRWWERIKDWWEDEASMWVYIIIFIAMVAYMVYIFADGIFASCTNNSAESVIIKAEQRDGLWGMVKGDDVIIPFEYDSIVCDRYDTIYSRIYKNGNVGLIMNSTGKEVVPCVYRNIGNPNNISLSGKLIAVQKDDGKWNFVDYSGKLTKYQNLKLNFAKWWADAEYGTVGMMIDNEMKYGYVDSSGYLKINLKYADANSFFEGLALVKKTKYGPWYCIDKDGNEQYQLKYTLGDIYQESLMAVTNSTKWDKNSVFGFIDRKGDLVIGMHFTPYLLNNGSFYYPRFSKGRAYVRYYGRNGYIDKTGKFAEE